MLLNYIYWIAALYYKSPLHYSNTYSKIELFTGFSLSSLPLRVRDRPM